jgi:hypothetical protein
MSLPGPSIPLRVEPTRQQPAPLFGIVLVASAIGVLAVHHVRVPLLVMSSWTGAHLALICAGCKRGGGR